MEHLTALHGSKRVLQGPLKGTAFKDLTWAQLERFAKRCSEPELRNYARAAMGTRALEPSDVQPCRPIRAAPGTQALQPISSSRTRAQWVRCQAYIARAASAVRQLSGPALLLVAFAITVLSRPQAHYIVGRCLVLGLRWLMVQTLGVAFQFLDALLSELIAWLRDEPSEPTLSSFADAGCPRWSGLGPLGQVLLSCSSVLMGALVTHLAQRLQLPGRVGRPVLRL